MGHSVFIVHADADKAKALRLRDALAKLGVYAFVDRPDTPAGATWATEIPARLREAVVAVVLVGAKDGHYQREEIAQAIKDKRAIGAVECVVPVLLQARKEMPYGLDALQALTWEGAEAVAAIVAKKVEAIRGIVAGGQRRVTIAVVGLKDELGDALDALRTRISRRTSILDGDVRLVDLARDSVPEVDLRVVLLGGRHGGKLDVFAELAECARRDGDAGDTAIGALAIELGKIPKPFRAETLDVQDLHDGITITGDAITVVDALDDRVEAWYAARFPAKPGQLTAREPWEERYLKHKAPLWRKGDPSALRSLGGARVDRTRWYVHLKADYPWVDVDHEVRWGIVYSPDMVLRDYHEAIGASMSVGAPEALRDLVTVTARPVREGDFARPWLDAVLSHSRLPRMIVVGPAGTGKTVLLQHVAWVLSTDNASGSADQPAHRVDRAGVRGESPLPPIPILHTASTLATHLRGDRTIHEALVSVLRSSDTFGELADAPTIHAGIETGRYVFLIDSLDEVPRRQDREALVAALGTLTGPVPRVVLTTRPSAHTAVELPSGFARVDIAPLDDEAQERLARAWATSWAPADDVGEILRAVATVRGNFPAAADERSPVENPLLLSCILQVYATYHRLPDDTAKLYADMVRVLCEARVRATDDVQRDTIVERYRVALRHLSFATQERGGTRLGVAEAKAVLVACRFSSHDRVENELQALANHTGLIRFGGAGDKAEIRPWHRSYQEYLAAEMIVVDYANRAAECVAWLRAPRGDRGARLTDPSWRGTLRFLIGAATHYDPAWGARLVEALAGAAAEPDDDRARLLALAVEGAAEYAGSLFANEPIRQSLPHTVVVTFAANGADWPVDDRVEVLDALGRLGDPRLPDPRTAKDDVGWVEVPAGRYTTGATPPVSRKPSSAAPRSRRGGKKGYETTLEPEVHPSPGFWIRRWPVTVAEFLPFVEEAATGAWVLSRGPGAGLDGLTTNPLAWWRAKGRHPSRPITEVTWRIAREFCFWAQARWRLPAEGIVDLPTSAEWEIAARRNTDRKYAWGDDPPGARHDSRAAYAWIGATIREGATPVGAFPRGHSPEGLWDLTGNVGEWCASRRESDHDEDLAIDEAEFGPVGQAVYRGASWRHTHGSLCLVRRGDQPPLRGAEWLGFRVVLRPKREPA